MLQQLWAKTTAREKFVVYGAAAIVLGVLVGFILASKSYGGGSISGISIPGVSVNYFTAGGTVGLFAFIALLAAIVAVGAIYVRVADVKFTWPVPYAQALMILAIVGAVASLLVLLFQFIRDGGLGPEPPITLYIADLLILVGGGLLGWVAYQEYLESKKPV